MARRFNSGNGDFADAGAGVNSPAAITISCWVANFNYPTAYQALVSRNTGTAFYQFFVESSGTLAIYVSATGGTVSYDPGTIALSSNVTTPPYYHVAFVYSSVVGLIGYVNGVVDQTAAANGTLTSAAAAHLTFSKDTQNVNRNFNAYFADPAQWSVALSAGEIAALASGANPDTIRPQSLDGFWPFDGQQSPEPDLSGKANNATLTGTVIAPGPPVNMLTPRGSRFLTPAAAASTVVQRRTLDNLGTRVGSRQLRAA